MIDTFEHGWHDECACGHPYGVHDEHGRCYADTPGNYRPNPSTTYHVCFCHRFIAAVKES